MLVGCSPSREGIYGMYAKARVYLKCFGCLDLGFLVWVIDVDVM